MFEKTKDKIRMKIVEAAAIASATMINMFINKEVERIKKERGIIDEDDLKKGRKK